MPTNATTSTPGVYVEAVKGPEDAFTIQCPSCDLHWRKDASVDTTSMERVDAPLSSLPGIELKRGQTLTGANGALADGESIFVRTGGFSSGAQLVVVT